MGQQWLAISGLLLALSVMTTSAVETAPPSAVGVTSPAVGTFALNGEMKDNFTCVAGCSCQLTDFTRSRYGVLCSGASIRRIPNFLREDLHQIESMTLTRTSIAQIDWERMFSSLTYLNLNQSLVQGLDSNLVTTFPALETLLLAGNRLRQLVDFNMLQHLSLREVDLSANQLIGFDPSGSMSLRVLSLRQNALVKLDDLGPQYTALRRLDVSENRLTLQGLGGWEPPPELEVLDLSGNQLKGGGNASFLQLLPQLQQLVLSGNQLDALAPIVNSLPPNSKLWKLSLAGNPFVCSCALYRDKERLATQGVIIADSPVCRLPNGTEHPLMRLGSWACAEIDGGGGGELSSAGGLTLQSPLVIAVASATATCLACLAIGVGVCLCRRQHQRAPQASPEPEYPYNNSSVKSTNLTGSQASIATSYRSGGLSYALDPQRSRVFSKKLIQTASFEHQTAAAAMGMRCQSEQILGVGFRGSAPLPPIPDGTGTTPRSVRQQPPLPPRPEDYVDMSGYQQVPRADATTAEAEGYDEVRLPQYQNLQLQLPADAGPEGYVDMQ